MDPSRAFSGASSLASMAAASEGVVNKGMFAETGESGTNMGEGGKHAAGECGLCNGPLVK